MLDTHGPGSGFDTPRPSGFESYDAFSASTEIYNCAKLPRVAYLTFGLGGEAGEFEEKIKKLYRDHDGVITPERRVELLKELGDVLWYVSRLACTIGGSLREVAELNVAKLRDRQARDKLHGEGDAR